MLVLLCRPVKLPSPSCVVEVIGAGGPEGEEGSDTPWCGVLGVTGRGGSTRRQEVLFAAQIQSLFGGHRKWER